MKYTTADIKRFWSYVDLTRIDSCWLWLGYKVKDGYGALTLSEKAIGKRRTCVAHRLSWMLCKGPIPKGFYVLHDCDNPPCVNPAHLFLGSQFDNMRDMQHKQRGPNQKGSNNGRAKLTEKDVLYLREVWPTLKRGKKQKIAAKFDVAYSRIRDAVTGRTWKHLQNLKR